MSVVFVVPWCGAVRWDCAFVGGANWVGLINTLPVGKPSYGADIPHLLSTGLGGGHLHCLVLSCLFAF